MNVYKLYSWIVSVLEKDSEVDENYLRANVNSEDLEHIFFLLNYLVSKGYLKVEIIKNNTKFVVLNLKEIRETLEKLIGNQPLKPEAGLKKSLVVSVPLSLMEEFDNIIKRHDLPVLLLKDTIKILLNNAREEVLIASPFIEWDGLMYVADELMNIAKKGISIKLITRDVIDAKNDTSYSYVKKLRAISKLSNIYESNKSRPDIKLSIRDFGTNISGLTNISVHYEGIHQKMVIVDKKYAYVGSGEIRSASFMTNGEAGYLVVGSEAVFWTDFFNLFWRTAREIPSEYLKYK